MDTRDLSLLSDLDYKVRDGQSVRYADDLGDVQIVLAGERVPDDFPEREEQLIQWLAGGFIERLDDPDNYEKGAKHKPRGPGSAAMQKAAKGAMRERAAEQRQERLDAARAARQAAKPKAPAKPKASKAKSPPKGERMEVPGIWNFDPDGFEGVPLDNLKVRIAEVMAAHGIDVPMPSSVEDCIKLLSSQYVPGTQPE